MKVNIHTPLGTFSGMEPHTETIETKNDIVDAIADRTILSFRNVEHNRYIILPADVVEECLFEITEI